MYFIRYYLIYFLLIFPLQSYSYHPGPFAEAFHQVMEPLAFFVTVLHTLCRLIGGAFVLGAIMRYVQYKHNPGQTPLNQPLMLGLLGLILFGLPSLTRYALVYPHVFRLPDFLIR